MFSFREGGCWKACVVLAFVADVGAESGEGRELVILWKVDGKVMLLSFRVSDFRLGMQFSRLRIHDLGSQVKEKDSKPMILLHLLLHV